MRAWKLKEEKTCEEYKRIVKDKVEEEIEYEVEGAR